MEFLFLVVVLPIIIVLFRGLMLKFLWGWYMVPIFSLPALSLVQATGLVILILLTTYRANDLRGENALARLGQSTYATLAYLIFGWLFHFFM